jgi:hypothetical protein
MPDLGGGYQMNPQRAQAAADRQQSATQSAGKVSAADAKYQDVAGTCATCSHFQGDGQPCAVIVEPVSAGGWCSLYEEGQPQTDQGQNADAAAAAPPAGAASPQGT